MPKKKEEVVQLIQRIFCEKKMCQSVVAWGKKIKI